MEKIKEEMPNPLSSRQKIEWGQFVLQRLSDMIKFADQKALILLAIVSFMGGHLLAKITDLHLGVGRLVIGVAAVAALALLGSVALCFKVVYPRLQKDAAKGIIYWGDIIDYPSRQAFHENFEKLDESALIQSLSAEIYHVSHINKAKYRALQQSFGMAGIGTIFAIALLLIL